MRLTLIEAQLATGSITAMGTTLAAILTGRWATRNMQQQIRSQAIVEHEEYHTQHLTAAHAAYLETLHDAEYFLGAQPWDSEEATKITRLARSRLPALALHASPSSITAAWECYAHLTGCMNSKATQEIIKSDSLEEFYKSIDSYTRQARSELDLMHNRPSTNFQKPDIDSNLES